MFSTADTIVAIATPAGRGAIGIVRLSGPDSQSIAAQILSRREPLPPRVVTLARFAGEGVSDQVVAVLFAAPASYTGDDVVEISAHGSNVVLESIVRAAISKGARLARPGEFTLRAFINGKIDLPQAEAVADLVDAVTPLQARTAFDLLNGGLSTTITELHADLFGLIAKLEASIDFPDEGYHFATADDVERTLADLCRRISCLVSGSRTGRLIRSGARVAILGPPNAGKSRLFNALVGANRAIVSPTAGTTRDLITETVEMSGIPITLVDTAGLREADDDVEHEGIARARSAGNDADVVLMVIDGSAPLPADINIDARTILIANKCDLPQYRELAGALRVSAETGEGLAELNQRVSQALLFGEDKPKDTVSLCNLRHEVLLRKAGGLLESALAEVRRVGAAAWEDLLLVDLQEARGLLEEVAGRRTADDVLTEIFSRFCIGK